MTKTKAEAKPKGVSAPATKRDINRLKRETADLWVELTEVECKLNAIIELKVQRLPDLTVEQDAALTRIRKRLEHCTNETHKQGDLFDG